jgi:hypothetical protein
MNSGKVHEQIFFVNLNILHTIEEFLSKTRTKKTWPCRNSYMKSVFIGVEEHSVSQYMSSYDLVGNCHNSTKTQLSKFFYI